MKTYTFKIKLQHPKDDYPVILSVVHCPLEVLFDSLKEVEQFNELYNALFSEAFEVDTKPLMYVTASDYVINNSSDYVSNDYLLCTYKAIVESKSLTELLTHTDYFDFVDDVLTTKTEKDLVKELLDNERSEKNEV